MKKVSIIVPNYNHARYLRERLDSVFAQTFRDFEVIILDDASIDESAAVIRPYLQLPDVRFEENTRNTGCPFVQWEKGVRMANGEYIWLAESDDIADVTFLENLVPLLDNNPSVGLAYCQSWRIGPEGQPMGDLRDWTEGLDSHHWGTAFVNDGRKECANYLIHKNTVPNASAVLFRKTAYSQFGLDPSGFRLCGDWCVWVNILMRHNVAFTPLKLNSFRCHPSSVRQSTSKVTLLEETIRIQRYMMGNLVISENTVHYIIKNKIADLLNIYRTASSGKRLTLMLKMAALCVPFFIRAPSSALDAFLTRHSVFRQRIM